MNWVERFFQSKRDGMFDAGYSWAASNILKEGTDEEVQAKTLGQFEPFDKGAREAMLDMADLKKQTKLKRGIILEQGQSVRILNRGIRIKHSPNKVIEVEEGSAASVLQVKDTMSLSSNTIEDCVLSFTFTGDVLCIKITTDIPLVLELC